MFIHLRLRTEFSILDGVMHVNAALDAAKTAGQPVLVADGVLHPSHVSLFFMAARLPATKWTALHPGVQTSADIQQRMIEDMRRAPPRFLVLDSAWDENVADAPEGAHLLDAWLAECHTEAARVETIRILAPRADGGGRCMAPAS